MDDAYASRFPVQVVGAQTHAELWVPAEELEEFNAHLLGRIKVVDSYYGERYVGDLEAGNNLPVGL